MSHLPRMRPLEIIRLPEADGAQFLLRDPAGYSEDELMLSEAALFVAAHLDGEHTLDQLRTNFTERYGAAPSPDQVQTLVARLGAAHMMEDADFFARREALHAAFAGSPVRAAAHAGISYPREREDAEETYDRFREEAAALLDGTPAPPGVLRAVVAPHIDLREGGAATALAWSLVHDRPAIETVVVLGTAHAYPRPGWLVYDKPYDTPLGEVPVHREAAARLAAASPATPQELFHHRHEHSVEFQAFFLAGMRAAGREINFVPVLCGALDRETPPADDDPFLLELGRLLEELGEGAIAVAAADLAHVGPRFGDPEALSDRHLGLLETKDRATLATVEAGDAGAFFAAVAEGNDPRRICGLSPIYSVLRALPSAKGRLLHYAQASDSSGTVSYATLGLWSPPSA